MREGGDVHDEYLAHCTTGEQMHVLRFFSRRVDVAMRDIRPATGFGVDPFWPTL